MIGVAAAGLPQDNLGFHTIFSQILVFKSSLKFNTSYENYVYTVSWRMFAFRFCMFTLALAGFNNVYFKVCAVFACDHPAENRSQSCDPLKEKLFIAFK